MRRSASLLATALAHGLLAGTALAQTTYSVTAIGPLPGHNGSFAAALDDAGRVCAWSDTIATLLWFGGRTTELPPLPGGTTTRCEGLGPGGSVLGGSSTAASWEHAVLWERGPSGYVPIDLGVAPGDVQALALASNGRTVVGLSDDAFVARPAAWRRSAAGAGTFVVDVLPLLPGDFGGVAQDVDAYGRIVGSSADFGSARAVLWEPVGSTWTLAALPGLAPFASAEALALNDAGVVVGYSISPTTLVEHAVAWRAGVVHDLGAPVAGWRSVALSVNERGDVVGRSGPFNFTSGWVRPAGTQAMVLLDDHLPTDSPWTIVSAEDVDERGRIVATGILGGFYQTCLLTPVETFLVGPPAGSAGGLATLVVQAATPGALVRFHAGDGGGASPLLGCPAQDLDITGAQLIGTAVVDALGQAQLTVPVPAVLAGTTLWFQASEASSCRVTNVERVVL